MLFLLLLLLPSVLLLFRPWIRKNTSSKKTESKNIMYSYSKERDQKTLYAYNAIQNDKDRLKLVKDTE